MGEQLFHTQKHPGRNPRLFPFVVPLPLFRFAARRDLLEKVETLQPRLPLQGWRDGDIPRLCLHLPDAGASAYHAGHKRLPHHGVLHPGALHGLGGDEASSRHPQHRRGGGLRHGHRARVHGRERRRVLVRGRGLHPHLRAFLRTPHRGCRGVRQKAGHHALHRRSVRNRVFGLHDILLRDGGELPPLVLHGVRAFAGLCHRARNLRVLRDDECGHKVRKPRFRFPDTQPGSGVRRRVFHDILPREADPAGGVGLLDNLCGDSAFRGGARGAPRRSVARLCLRQCGRTERSVHPFGRTG